MNCHCVNCTHAVKPATYWVIDEGIATAEELAIAFAYDMSDPDVAEELLWTRMSTECLQYWYEGGGLAEGDGAYESADENTKWWKRPINPPQN
jgi:hypothetical protein